MSYLARATKKKKKKKQCTSFVPLKNAVHRNRELVIEEKDREETD